MLRGKKFPLYAFSASKESYGCGIGIVGGWGIEGMGDRVVRDGLGVSVAFTSMACPFLYTVKLMLFPAILC